MRSSFGITSAALRQRLGMTQSDFSRRIGESVARVSNLEHHRTHIGEEVLQKYQSILCANEAERNDLREHAEYSNSLRRHDSSGETLARILALLEKYGPQLSERAANSILNVLQDEVGGEIAALKLRNYAKAKKPHKFPQRPTLNNTRFAEICLAAEEVRRKYSDNRDRLDLLKLIDCEALETERLDLDVLDVLPKYAHDSFACIVGHAHGHTILLKEDAYQKVASSPGSRWVRHVLAHELGHHFLHPELLETENECYLPVQYAAKIDSIHLDTSSQESGSQNWRLIDTITEEEAECFATMLLVPWSEFLLSRDFADISRRFGADNGSVMRFGRYILQPAVQDAFRGALWTSGRRDHPIFKL